MNVETSKHDELWTTRRRVMMNVDMQFHEMNVT